jgi:hypothetical protein
VRDRQQSNLLIVAMSLKPSSKEVLADAMELHEERGATDLTQLQAYLLIATAALSKAESCCPDVTEADDETRKLIKRARKMMTALLPEVETNANVEEKGLDLGQYAHTKVFEGDNKKVEKFARLMGGKAAMSVEGQHTHHNTFAPDSKTSKRITHEIEEQFNSALHHKGKKGLGC